MAPSDDMSAALAWLEQFQGLRPEGKSLADPASAAVAAAQAARRSAAPLAFDADPTGFTDLLESLVRK